MEKRPRPTTTYRWWLRLQLGLLLAGGITWLIGAAVDEAFVTGAGAGMLVAALALRLGRRAAQDSPHRDEGESVHRRADAPGAAEAGEDVP